MTTHPTLPELLDELREKYPLCFPRSGPKPLKVGIYKDLAQLELPKNLLKSFMRWYVTRQDYKAALKSGAPRFDLDGSPVGTVTEAQAAHALKQTLPTDKPLTEANIVAGKLEITLKINELPKPSGIQVGYKFGVNCDGRLISVTLNPKAWDKLAKAAASYDQWVAAVSGKMGPAEGNGFILLEPSVQVFEKKPKEAIPKTIVDDPASDGKAVKAAAQKPEVKVSNSRFGSTLKLGAK